MTGGRTDRSTARSIADLVDAGLIDPARAAGLGPVTARYPVGVSPTMLSLIDPNDPHDPIARQFLPTDAELSAAAGDLEDPIGDARHSPVDGIVHRYPDRVLLKLLHVCPVYCRFCFRREMVGPGRGALSGPALDRALGYIADHPEIWEVILTGGDPLVMRPRRLAGVLGRLRDIRHVQTIRIHTRVPVVSPERVDADMVAALSAETDRPVWISVHTNHARELGPAAAAAIRRLARAGLPLVSQTVLLRGVNDDAGALEALFRRLVAIGVKPYYIHHPDPAPGTAHFRVSVAEGRRILADVRRRCSGLCLPIYMRESPGGDGKTAISY